MTYKQSYSSDTDLQTIEDNSFRYEEESQPAEYVETLAENMHLYPPEHYITGDRLYYKYDPKVSNTFKQVPKRLKVFFSRVVSHSFSCQMRNKIEQDGGFITHPEWPIVCVGLSVDTLLLLLDKHLQEGLFNSAFQTKYL